MTKCSFSAYFVEEAVSNGVKLLCFPENFSYVGAKQGDGVRVAQALDGPIMQGYCNLARCPKLLTRPTFGTWVNSSSWFYFFNCYGQVVPWF